MRKPFEYNGCRVEPETLPEPRLIGCNNSVNRYLRQVWRAIFPDKTWCLLGTKRMARSYIDAHKHQH